MKLWKGTKKHHKSSLDSLFCKASLIFFFFITRLKCMLFSFVFELSPIIIYIYIFSIKYLGFKEKTFIQHGVIKES